MLAQLTAVQYQELILSFRVEEQERERIRQDAQESKLRHFFDKVRKKQEQQ